MNYPHGQMILAHPYYEFSEGERKRDQQEVKR
jgi:hypothetical protein